MPATPKRIKKKVEKRLIDDNLPASYTRDMTPLERRVNARMQACHLKIATPIIEELFAKNAKHKTEANNNERI